MRHTLLLLILPLLTAAVAAAQTVEPKEPQIVLPPVLLKVQDVTQEKIDTPLPAEQPPALPEIDVALPQAQNIQLGAAAYEVPVPAQGPSGGTITVQPKQTSNFFSDGLIGAGSMNHILGDITLYKLGEDPRFNLEFSHERIDGYLDPLTGQPYHYWPAGAGFFNRTDAVVGSLTTAAKGLFSLDTHDFYRETENGLQGKGAYSSVTHRFISGDLKSSYLQLKPFTIGAGVKATSGDMTLSSPTPSSAINAQELSVKPTVSLGLDLSHVTGNLTGFYGFSTNTGQTQFQQQNAGGTLSVNAELPLALTLNASVGGLWDSTIGWAVPFSLELDGVYKDLLTYRLYGGYKVDQVSYFQLWTQYPFLNHNQILASSSGWYGGVSTNWRFGKNLALQGAVDFSNMSNAVMPVSIAQDGTGLFAFTQGDATTLTPKVSFSWDPQGPFSVTLGWSGNFINPVPFTPVNSFKLDAGYNDSGDKYGATVSGTMDLFKPGQGSTLMPNLGLSGYFRVSDGVTFHLDMSDLLSPFTQSGRTTWNTYTDPGFRVTVTTQISL